MHVRNQQADEAQNRQLAQLLKSKSLVGVLQSSAPHCVSRHTFREPCVIISWKSSKPASHESVNAAKPNCVATPKRVNDTT
jgi:hypothetical protein